MTFTHNQIVKLLQDTATNHQMIKSFGFGDIWEEGATEQLQPLVLWGIDLEHKINRNVLNETSTIDLNYKLIIMDLVDKGENMENDVLSDTLQITLDVLAVLGYKSMYPFYQFSYSTIKPFTERLDSEYTGHEVDITFTMPFDNNICQVPLDNLPTSYTPTPSGGIEWSAVPSSRTLTINGTTYDLSENRTWTISTGNTYTAGTGLSLTGTVFSIDNTVVTLTGSQALTNKTGNISQWTNDSGYLTSLTGAVTSVSGTINRITSTGGATPVIDISASYVGQTSLTTLGTIATGTWQGTSISTTYTDAKIKGSLAATAGLIGYGTGTADTISTNANFLFDSANVGLIVGDTALGASTDVARFQKNQNAATAFRIYNTTSGTAAQSFIQLLDGTDAFNFGFTNTSFTPSGAITAKTAYLQGTGTGGLVLQATNAGGAIQMTTGGATVRLSISSAGVMTYGTSAASSQHIFNVGSSTSQIILREKIGATTQAAFYIGVASGSESSTNYTINYNGTLQINSQSTTTPLSLKTGDSAVYTVTPTNTSSVAHHQWSQRTRLTLTASTTVASYLFGGNTQQWATGAITNQYFTHFLSNTMGFVAASTATNVFGVFIEQSTVGTNAVITNNYALGLAYDSSNYLGVAVSSAGVITHTAVGASARHNFANKLSSTHPTGGIGYNTGAGGTITQITSKATGVTLNKVCGQITMNNAALLGGASVTFTLTNSAITTTDTIHTNYASGGTIGAYRIDVDNITAGTCDITVTNLTGGSLSEAIVINYAILKGVAA